MAFTRLRAQHAFTVLLVVFIMLYVFNVHPISMRDAFDCSATLCRLHVCSLPCA